MVTSGSFLRSRFRCSSKPSATDDSTTSEMSPSMKSFNRFALNPEMRSTPGVSAVAGKSSVSPLRFQKITLGTGYACFHWVRSPASSKRRTNSSCCVSHML